MISPSQSDVTQVQSPLKSGGAVRLLERISVQELSERWRKDFGVSTQEFVGLTDIYLYECQDTGLHFFWPPSIAGRQALYESLQRFSWYYQPFRWEHRVALSSLRSGEKVLEIGCGSGGFVREALKKQVQARGVELNTAAVNDAKQAGLPVEKMLSEQAVLNWPQSFDAVCAFQVLEHLSNPKQFFTDAIALLKPAGRLIICVPNAASFLRFSNVLLDLPPHHMTRWTSQVFGRVTELFPLKLTRVLMEPLASYHVPSFVRSLPNRYSRCKIVSRIFSEPKVQMACRTALRLGFRLFLRGQSIYVEFTKS